jgi:hypothetical protein
MKVRVQAQHLRPGDVVGSGEVIAYVGAGLYTPKGKVDVKMAAGRWCHWGKYTLISAERHPVEVYKGNPL